MTALFSLMTAAMVLAAFRLPALMMFRGFTSPLGFRRPIMVVRAPMARSITVAGTTSLPSNISTTISPPTFHYPMPRPQLWPFPGPLVPPMHYFPPSKATQQHLPNQIAAPPLPLPLQSLLLQLPQPSHSFAKPVFAPTRYPNVIKDLKSKNNRPLHQYIHKHDYETRGSMTTHSPQYDDRLHQIIRPLNRVNKYQNTPKEYSLKKTTEYFNNLNGIHSSGNEELRHEMIYPMPRNYQNHRMDSNAINATKLVTSHETLPLTTIQSTTTSITTTQKIRLFTKIRPKQLLKLRERHNDLLIDSLLGLNDSKQTNSTSTSTSGPKLKFTKNRIRLNKTRIKSMTTTEITTIMTPAPIENYKPIKARVQTNSFHANHRDSANKISERLMFDETKNQYYLVTLKPIQ